MEIKRIIALFFTMMTLYGFLVVKLMKLSHPGSALSQAALTHGSYTLELCSTRGTIYDSSLRPLVNTNDQYLAVVTPGGNMATQLTALSPYVGDIRALTQKLSQRLPFFIGVSSPDIGEKGVDVVKVSTRYADKAVAPALIGYLDGEGSGTAGIEKAFDEQLKGSYKKVTASFQVDANGRLLQGVPAAIRVEGPGDTGGVVLTLDRDIQQAAQQAADKYLKAGAVVVMDPKSGDIVACVSNPTFSPNDLAAAVKGEDAPMLNRAFSAYNVGSVFKISNTAAALESGIRINFSCTCNGSIDVGGQIFHCHLLTGHGDENMEQGFENSCNPYFITLGQQAGAEKLLNMARKLGFGTANDLAPGLSSAAGSLPDIQTLRLPAALANFSIGQGDLMATPVQIARMVSAVANGGLLPTPRLVAGLVDNQKRYTETYPNAVPDRVFSEKTAQVITQFMIETVENGTGKPAKPAYGGAGGKTATAETGWVKDGKTINQAWFAGFYPAQNPKYVIVAICENGVAGGSDAGPVFKYIADFLAPRCGYPAVENP